MAKMNWTVVKVPYGGGYCSLNLAKPKNARKAPEALQREFTRQRVFMADNGVSSWDNIPWLEIPLGFSRQNNAYGWERMCQAVLNRLNNINLKDTNILFLGGSHSITASTYNRISGVFGRQQTGLIVLDAHPDCCSKADWPIHSDWLHWLVEDEFVLPENVLIIGLRQMEKLEKEFLDKFNIKYFRMSAINDPGNLATNDFSAMRVLERFRKLAATYLSIDIDVASGAYAPGTGCPSPGGFTDTELINLVKKLKVALPNLKAADIVEISPLNWWRKRILRYDPTVDLGVKLIKEIIS
ncbi:MAG: arginase family protein [bacterium]|nr:arginase family protein [bacterium]